MGFESIAHWTFGLMGYIDSEAMRAISKIQLVGQKY